MDAPALFPILLATLILDSIWLTARYKYHMDLFQSIQKSKLNVRWIPAVLIYVVIAIAIYIFAVKQAKTSNQALIRGAIVGFLFYAFYDLTNYATLSGWTLELAVTDIAWGTFLCAIASFVGFYFQSKR
jgi:uncharacterized membrane protein